MKLTLTMAVSDYVMHIASYNLHGLNQGAQTLQHLCAVVNSDVIMVQEHWQSTDKLNKILRFSNDYTGFGICAFEDKINSGILHGRMVVALF